MGSPSGRVGCGVIWREGGRGGVWVAVRQPILGPWPSMLK